MFGRRRLITTAMWALVLPTLLCAAAASLSSLVFWRFMQGLLLPFIFTVTVAYISDEAEGAAGIRLVGDYALGTIFGGFAGRFLTGYAAAFAGWRFSFLFLAALTLAAAVVVQWMLPAERQ